MPPLPIPDVQPVLTEAPKQGYDASIFRRPEKVGIGSGLEALSQGIEALATTAAEKAGRDDAAAVQRNADGSVTPVPSFGSHFLMGNAGRAYQNAFMTGSLAAVQTDVNEKAQTIRNDFPNDPDGFKLAWGKYMDGLRSSLPGPLGAAAFNHATQVGSQHAISLIEDKRKSDLGTSYTNITTRIDDLRNEISGVARNTSSDTPDFIEKLPQYDQLKGNYASLALNPEFNVKWTKEKVDSELSIFKEQAYNEWVIGNAKRVRDAKGIDEAVKWAEKATMGSSSLPVHQREAAFHSAVAQIQSLTEEQKATLRGSEAAIHSFTQLYHNGTPPTDEQYQAILNTARKSFNVEGVAQLQAARDAYERGIKPYAGLSPVAGANAVMGAGKNATAPREFDAGNMGGFLDRVKSIENPTGNPAAVSPTGARGDFQFTKGTWAQFGQGDINNPADNRAAAGRLAQANAQTLRTNLGRKPTEGEVYLAHQQGSAGASALIQHPDMNAVEALTKYAGLSPADAARNIRVNGGNSSMTAAEFANKWTKRFDGEGVVAGRASPIPFSGEELARNPWLASAAVGQYTADKARMVQFGKDQIELVNESIKMGLPPPVERVAQVIQLAQTYPQELGEASTRIQASFAASKIAAQAAGMPDGGAAFMAEANKMAIENPDLSHLAFAQALQTQIEGRAKQLADDPHAYAARPEVGWIKNRPTPFEALANPAAVGAQSPAQVMQAAIADRREAGFQLGSRMGVPPASMMFTKNDVKSIGSLLQRADGAGASMILRSLEGQLQPAEMQALAGNKDFVNAVGGLARSGDPGKVAAAFGFMDKQYRENAPAFAKEYGKDMVTKMAVWQGKIAFMGPDAAVKELQRQDDPATKQAAAALHAQADKDLKDLTPEQVVNSVFDTAFSWQPGNPVSDTAQASAGAMLSDYRSIYRDVYAAGGDKTLAENEAKRQLQLKWGVSALNGNRVMAYPPEAHYPPDIYGRKDYIKAQLQNDLADLAATKYQGMGVSPEKLRAAEHVLVADDRTQEDIANRVPPSYRVIVKDDAGQWVPLMADARTAFRFRADPQAAIEPQKERFLVERRQRQFVQGAM